MTRTINGRKRQFKPLYTPLEQRVITIVIILFFGGILSGLASCNIRQHTCQYVNCPYQGETAYTHQHGTDNNEECDQREDADDIGSDCDALDYVHFNHPDFSYDECEEFLFGNLQTSNHAE